MSDGADRRQHERFELLARVDLQRGVDVAPLTVINISAGGVLLRNDDNVDFRIGDDIRLHFDVPQLRVNFTISATIVRVIAMTSKPAALAAMWTSSDTAAAASLSQLLWSLKGTST
jgi:hypothetical protein